ncbi:MAG: hypothetical protein R3D66_02735 [Alphaproteobacteria bacterium]
MVEKIIFTPEKSLQGRQHVVWFLLLFSVLIVTGCSNLKAGSGPAPAPPSFTLKAERDPITKVAIQNIPSAQNEPVTLASANIPAAPSTLLPANEIILSAKSQNTGQCRIKDRFDRDEVLAYTWGDNRLGMDVDGLSLSNFEMEQVKLQYRLKLQSYKSQKERCRYPSQWQGLVGTGYNELFVRETDTVWQELKALQNDVEDRWDSLVY